jgi:hypothetical protein
MFLQHDYLSDALISQVSFGTVIGGRSEGFESLDHRAFGEALDRLD